MKIISISNPYCTVYWNDKKRVCSTRYDIVPVLNADAKDAAVRAQKFYGDSGTVHIEDDGPDPLRIRMRDYLRRKGWFK